MSWLLGMTGMVIRTPSAATPIPLSISRPSSSTPEGQCRPAATAATVCTCTTAPAPVKDAIRACKAASADGRWPPAPSSPAAPGSPAALTSAIVTPGGSGWRRFAGPGSQPVEVGKQGVNLAARRYAHPSLRVMEEADRGEVRLRASVEPVGRGLRHSGEVARLGEERVDVARDVQVEGPGAPGDEPDLVIVARGVLVDEHGTDFFRLLRVCGVRAARDARHVDLHETPRAHLRVDHVAVGGEHLLLRGGARAGFREGRRGGHRAQ